MTHMVDKLKLENDLKHRYDEGYRDGEHARCTQIEEIQTRLFYALQMDLEGGAAWLNGERSAEFHRTYPALSQALKWIADLELPDAEETRSDDSGGAD